MATPSACEPIRDLPTLLASMQPVLAGEGDVVFVKSKDLSMRDAAALDPWMLFREDEALTLILPTATADAQKLSHDGTMRRITLKVHSSLEAVGLTAAVSACLTEAGISANVVAAYHHDHIYVPSADADRAVAALQSLSSASASAAAAAGA